MADSCQHQGPATANDEWILISFLFLSLAWYAMFTKAPNGWKPFSAQGQCISGCLNEQYLTGLCLEQLFPATDRFKAGKCWLLPPEDTWGWDPCCFGYLLHRAAVSLGIARRKSVCNKAQTVPFVDIIVCKTFWRVSQLPDYFKIWHQNCSPPMNSITEGFCLLCFQKDKPPKRKTKW